MAANLGQAWIDLVEKVVSSGTAMGNEGLEVLGANVTFFLQTSEDPVLARFGDQQMITEMKKVFFSEGANALGHSYAKSRVGPGGRHDLQDVISLLQAEPATKRALVSFLGQAGGKVPCISSAQFLVRDEAVQLIYFARGQDAYKKFYADALCLGAMADTVAQALGRRTGIARGFIGSAHVYHQDMPAIRQMLSRAREAKPQGEQALA